MIDSIELYLLITAFLIAAFGLKSKNGVIAAVLLVEFCIMTGYQLVFGQAERAIYEATDFYKWKAFIQILFAAGYLAFFTFRNDEILVKVRWMGCGLAITAYGIAFYIFNTYSLATFGVDNPNYEPTMVKLSILQLIIAALGVNDGIRDCTRAAYDGICNRFATRNRKRV